MEMEVVPILRVADADVAVRWYERLGFTKHWEHRLSYAEFGNPLCPGTLRIRDL
jgi:ribosomal protein S18 acetylase RimI-like enzyme